MEANLRAAAPAAALLFASILAGCGGSASSPSAIADSMTKSIYADDLDGTIANFDDDTKKTVNRADLGQISDRMHELGDYKSLSSRESDPDKGRYEFDATFSRGQLVVQLRLDPSGKVGAYRIVPQTAPATAGAATTQNS
jgi:hypothetical protein